jgi:hypothetical protein
VQAGEADEGVALRRRAAVLRRGRGQYDQVEGLVGHLADVGLHCRVEGQAVALQQ